MLISNKSKQTIDSCRFCWMCRHVCPIGNATGRERNNARARALSLSMVERGMELTEDIIDNVYECALCGACTRDCATGWDPVAFTKEVRLEAALNGLLPGYINKLVDNLESTGNPYGKTEVDRALHNEIKSLPAKADILFFLGADARYIAFRQAVNAIRLLKKSEVGFTVLADEPDSGWAADMLLGKAEETRQTMLRAAERLRYKTVVAYDPADAKVFLREYREWGIEIPARVQTFTSFINGLLREGSLKPAKSGMAYTYQDPAHLARDLGETADAREILNACGYVREMLLHGKDTVWAGNLLLNEYMPEVMKRTAAARWRDAAASGADILVTASPSEYEILTRVKPEGMELMGIEEVVLRSCEV